MSPFMEAQLEANGITDPLEILIECEAVAYDINPDWMEKEERNIALCNELQRWFDQH